MSTRWSFVCLTHDPPLAAGEDGSLGGSGDYGKLILADLWRRRADYIAMDWETADAVCYSDPDKRPVWFLRQHPNCTIVIDSEYGGRFDPAAGTQTQLRSAHEITADLIQLVADARKITPGMRAVLYVGDLEAILYGTARVETKGGSQ